MKKVLVLLLFGLVAAEQMTFSTPGVIGKFAQLKGDSQKVPTSFLCGVQMGLQRRYQIIPSKCKKTCKKVMIFKKKCKVECSQSQIKFQNNRMDRFKGIFCDTIKNIKQKNYVEYGVYHGSTGITKCPKNQFVTGFQIRTIQKVGIVGMIILCKDPFRKVVSQVMVHEGLQGEWQPAYKTQQLIYGFRVEKSSFQNIIGFKFYTIPKPEIIDIDFDFQLKQSYEILEEIIDIFKLSNFQNTTVTRQVRTSNRNIYTKAYLNEDQLFYGYGFKKYFSYSLGRQYQIGLLLKQKTNDGKWIVQKKRNTQLLKQFQFGKSSVFKLREKETSPIVLLPCSKTSFQFVFSHINTIIPYKSIIRISNGVNQDQIVVKGVYSGVVGFSQIKKGIQQISKC